MSSPYLQYRTFEQLISDAGVDMPTYHQEGFIKPEQLIKIATRVNYELGLRIHQEKIAVLDIHRGKARLPADFHVLNYGMICLRFRIEEPVITGTQTEEIILAPLPEGINPCDCNPKPCLTRCGQHVYLKQTFKSQVRIFDFFAAVKIGAGKDVAKGCPNVNFHCKEGIQIKDGWVQANFDEGTIFINYLGNLEDENGQLLVPDHPLLNEYYEYSIKQRVLENMVLDREPVGDSLALIERRIVSARRNAMTVVNTPDFAELKETWELNRQAMLQRFYHIFS